MYVVFDEPKSTKHLEGWQAIIEGFDQIKAYSPLGDVFLINSSTGEIGILLTMAYGFHRMGSNDWLSFYENVMENPNFQKDVMSKQTIGEVENLLGPLGFEEVYIPTPYPALTN